MNGDVMNMGRKISKEKIIKDLSFIAKKLEALGEAERCLEVNAVAALLKTDALMPSFNDKGEVNELNKAVDLEKVKELSDETGQAMKENL
jgi:hypothetical protein